MSIQRPIPAHAGTPHFDAEPFRSVAFQELESCPLVAPSVCLNPLCSRHFSPTRDWAQYCSPECRAIGKREFRAIGTRVAPALLAWQMGRYAKPDTPQGALSRAGRKYYSQLAAEWLRHRRARIEMAEMSR